MVIIAIAQWENFNLSIRLHLIKGKKPNRPIAIWCICITEGKLLSSWVASIIDLTALVDCSINACICWSRPSKAAETLEACVESHAGCYVHTQTTLLIAFAARYLATRFLSSKQERTRHLLECCLRCRFLLARIVLCVAKIDAELENNTWGADDIGAVLKIITLHTIVS